MAESMSGQIVSIACALSKADESEKALLEMICRAQAIETICPLMLSAILLPPLLFYCKDSTFEAS